MVISPRRILGLNYPTGYSFDMAAKQGRQLLVIADDFGIGSNTTEGILQLASQGIVTGSVVLVNAPEAAAAVGRWRQLGSRLELGWHPNLTLDSPIASPSQVPSLVRPDGTFWPLGQFVKRWMFGLLDPKEMCLEWTLQLRRFIELVGHEPGFVNCHQHIGIFAPAGEILLQVLAPLRTKPYLRRVREPWTVLKMLPGARVKRAILSWLAGRFNLMQEAHGFPGNDWLAGITSPVCVEKPDFFVRWLRAMPGQVVELMCHPGRLDPSLIGRDNTEGGLLQQRVNELRWLRDPSFLEAASDAGFRLTTPAELVKGLAGMARCA